MSSGRDTTSRLRLALNPLLTSSLGSSRNQLSTPHSAVSATSGYTYSPSTTPASSIHPYNPVEWGQSMAPGHERPAQASRQSSSQDAQASPPPPPPYSPPRSQRPRSGVFETPQANTSAGRVPLHRPSPEPSANPSFPPPPNAGRRGGSRERRFGLPSLGRRRDRETTESTAPSETKHPFAASRPQTLWIQVPQGVERFASDCSVVPPNARRATSASAVETPTSARSRSASQTRWEPGMPLPPPPPGPPPSNSRSQSLTRTSEPMVSPPTRRPPPGGVTALGPVPPTPADWVDEDRQRRGKSPQPELTINTSALASSSIQASPETASDLSSGGSRLTRAGAVRGEKTLRERRNDSRTRHARGGSSASIQPLSNILVPQDPDSSQNDLVSRPIDGQVTEAKGSTPRPSAGLRTGAHTPPFSPRPGKTYPGTGSGQHVVPKALPTPPLQSRSGSSSSLRPDLHNSTSGAMPTSLSSIPLTKEVIVGQTAQEFCNGTIQRFQTFAQREQSAATDADRVKLFADFIVNESRIRRERYNSAIGAMGSEIFDLTRDLFRPMRPRRDSSVSQAADWTPQMSETTSNRDSVISVVGASDLAQQSSSAPTSAGLPLSPISGPPVNINWQTTYMPSLSPILSMSVSEAQDESSSRGRTSSRWWEAESVGSVSARLQRSKRESKYMGVPKEAREALQWHDSPNSSDTQTGAPGGSSSNDYPPEKVGWHEPDHSRTPQPARNSPLSYTISSPDTPSPSHLDISRLVTLPPPYPRHHPAVNNSHPELTATRTIVRTLSDMHELNETKEIFTKESQKTRETAASEASDRRQALRTNLQAEIASGNMSYAEAAAIEADLNETERSQAKELEKKDFDHFQTAVVTPLNHLLTTRIAQATSLFDELRSRLFVDTHASNPNLPQEEGDEQPELLEKLTLLKWIFEARENLHRGIFDLLSDRNDRYRDMIVTPYRIAGNDEKVRNAEAFFAEDVGKRRAAYLNECLQRTREFRDVVAENVERGVDMQLNAFWDIAPPLRRLLDKIPAVIDEGFGIQIPNSEYEENPSYTQHPLQYLFSLLLHTEKSTYQFIESQTNLQCLLHEVKEAVMAARARVAEAEGREKGLVEEERRAEEQRLTEDLKEKVRTVQEQWEAALGEGIKGVKERVGEWLLQTGGWDESLEDSGAGGV